MAVNKLVAMHVHVLAPAERADASSPLVQRCECGFSVVVDDVL